MPAPIDFDTNDFEKFFVNDSAFAIDELEISMQTTMDEYAGGLTQNYRFNESQLNLAAKNIERIEELSDKLHAADMYDLLKIFELRERLTVAKVLIEHLKARRETFVRELGDARRQDKNYFSGVELMICIDKENCVGCGKCVEICPGNLLTMKNSAR